MMQVSIDRTLLPSENIKFVEMACGRFQTGVINEMGEGLVWGCQWFDGWYQNTEELTPKMPSIWKVGNTTSNQLFL